MRTWEEIIKFDSGLTIGVHCVTLQLNYTTRVALVEITNRGNVYLLAKPNDGDMYSSWSLLEGDKQGPAGKGRNGIIVWGARNPECLARFDNPTAVIKKG